MSFEGVKISRRSFSRAMVGVAASQALPRLNLAQSAIAPRATDIVVTIKQHINMAWDEKTYRDTFKAGDPKIPVSGIASCFMDTIDVLKRAQSQGLNFVITHEPTFWTDADLITPIKDDPLYLNKMQFIEANRMVVWRFHDHLHRFTPDPMTRGSEELLQWNKDSSEERLYRFPGTRLRDIAEQVATRLYSRSVRIVGDPELPVRTVRHGSHSLGGNIRSLENADVVLCSEVREWETIEFARDFIASGAKKGLIVISHEAGEEEGMKLFANWMRTVVPSVRTVFVPTNDRLYLV